MSKIPRKALDWWLLICMDATVVCLIAWKHHFGEIAPTVGLASGLFSLAVLNVVFLTAIHARNKHNGETTSRKLLLAGVSLAAVAALIVAGTIYLTPGRSEYLDLALSNTPLSEIHPQRKAIFVRLLRRRQAISHEYQKAVAQMKPISPALYSPASFASTNTMQNVTAALTQAYDADVSDAAEQKQSMDEFRAEMGKIDPGYLKSFEAGDQNDQAERNNIMDLEGKWFDSTIALYKFAGSHSDEITVREGRLRFTNNTVQSEFTRLLEGSRKLYNAFQVQVQHQLRDHGQNRREAGLPPDF